MPPPLVNRVWRGGGRLKAPCGCLFLASNWRWHVILSLELMSNNHFVLIQLIGEWVHQSLWPPTKCSQSVREREGWPKFECLNEKSERKRMKRKKILFQLNSLDASERENERMREWEEILMVRPFIIFNDCEKRLATTEPNTTAFQGKDEETHKSKWERIKIGKSVSRRGEKKYTGTASHREKAGRAFLGQKAIYYF